MIDATDLIPPAWKWGGAAVLALALLALFTWQHLEIGRLETELASTRAEARKCGVDLGVQTVQIQVWKRAAAERAAQAAEALAAATRTRQSAEARVQTLYRLTLPSEECDALRTLVDTARGTASADSLRHPIAPE